MNTGENIKINHVLTVLLLGITHKRQPERDAE